MINHLWLGRIQGPTYYKPLLLAALLFPPALFFLNFGDSSLPRVAHKTNRHLTRKPSSVLCSALRTGCLIFVQIYSVYSQCKSRVKHYL